MAMTVSAWVQEASAAAESSIPSTESTSWLLWVLVALAVVLVIGGAAWGVVVWRRKRAAAAPRTKGPAIGVWLMPLWRRFYMRIPARARHYPTVVVMGSAGVGKTHAIQCHVDWAGQANQFRPSVDDAAAIQLYLGPDVVVHEVSAPLLRDVSGAAKRALRRLWRRMGPSATVVFVLDARTLLTTPPAAVRELAQLVRGKIGLFPRRVRTLLEVRVYLSHLDMIEGYEEFAGAVGPDHEGLDLTRLGLDPGEADRLIAGFDGHLAYALTSRTGDEFDRMVRFYAKLRELLAGLAPVVATLEGRDEPYAKALPVQRLYLGSLLPRSHIGDAFAVDRNLIARSIEGHHRRGLRGAAIAAAGSLVVLGLLASWHVGRVREAEARLDAFEKFVKDGAAAGRGGALVGAEACPSDCASVQISENEVTAARELATALRDMKRSNVIWLEHLFIERKIAIETRFEAALREGYLYPLLRCSRPLRALYVVALIYASRDNELGRIITEHRTSWAKELRLSAWIIDEYIAASDSDTSGLVVEAPCIKKIGREWPAYLERLTTAMRQDAITVDEAARLLQVPPLRGPEEYEFLKQTRQALAADNFLFGTLRQDLIDAPFDWWTKEQHAALTAIGQTVRDNMRVEVRSTKGWGLHDLVTELSLPPMEIPTRLEITIDELSTVIDGRELAALIMRSRARLLIDRVLDATPAARIQDGSAFFGESVQMPAAGVVKGYGGGPTEVIDGFYTRDAFEHHVAPVLGFAGRELLPLTLPHEDATPKIDHSPPRLAESDGRKLEQAVRMASNAYASEYRRELLEYYQSFTLDPASEMALPFVFRHFWQSSSWFTEFLHAVERNATLTLPADDPYFAPIARSLASFEPLAKLLKAESAVIPGLAPYQALLAKLQPKLTGSSGLPAAPELEGRLSALGVLMLEALQGKTADPAAQVREWLAQAGVDPEWHDPFLAPLEIVRDIGTENIITEVERAWQQEVRPVIRPLLARYPFTPLASVDAEPEDIEAIARPKGKERGEFWMAFDRLIAPVTTRKAGELAMLDGLGSLSGLLYLPRDLERMARFLWDADGARIPLKVVMRPRTLPSEPHGGRAASMAYLRSGGGAVHAFNQRPERQTLNLRWWDQGTSVFALEMRPLVGAGEARSYTIEEDGAFSFYRLLDRGAGSKGIQQRGTLTAIAIHRATRCPPGVPGGTSGLAMVWRVPVGDEGTASREGRMVLESDPWAAFAVRDCD